MLRLNLITLVLLLIAADAPPASKPSGVDDATWQRMLEIDGKAGEIEDLTADFEQQKFTAMLKKPLISSGRVLVRGPTMLWETRKPEPSALLVTADEARIYYPAEKTIEVYKVEQKLGQLAASPLPRLATLQKHFTFEPLPPVDGRLPLKLIPLHSELREHVEEVRVLLDESSGLMITLEMRDPDGDRTVITFSNAKPNSGLRESDLQIDAPPDVKITRPLQALEQ